MVVVSLIHECVSSQDQVNRPQSLQEDNTNFCTSVVDYAEDHQPQQQEEAVVRRTRRATAGCHSKPYRLPRSAPTTEVQLNDQVALPI